MNAKRWTVRAIRLNRRAGPFVLSASLSTLLLAGCSGGLPSLPKVSDLNPFKEVQQPLPGRRIPVMQTNDQKAIGELAPADAPIALPVQVANESWAQPGGSPNNAPGHLAFSGGLNRAWSADIGAGSSSSGRITAPPIVFQGRVFALDASGNVTAFNLGGGSAVWRASLVPEQEQQAAGFFEWSSSAKGGFGGGLAADNGRLYGVSGFGQVAAIDPATGKKLWEKNIGTPVRAAPTAVGDRLYIVTIEGRFYCLSGSDGAELWVARGIPQRASRVLNVSPAVENGVVIVPYPSGDLMALGVNDGQPRWSESLARARRTSQLASLSDAARPAIDNGTVFAVGHAGRMIATDVTSGERLWSVDVPGIQTPWVAGDTVFVASTEGQLLAVSRSDGKIRWTAKLPGSRNWAGPTLAGGKLWLVSDQGLLVGVEAVTGRVVTQQSVGSKGYIPPVVAQGRMFVLTDNANLVAFN